MTTVTPSDQAGAASAKRPATIPTQRSVQALRFLVLGTGEDAAAFRARATEAGAELAQRFSVRVTHVVVEDGVGEDDARVVRARGAGLPVLGLVEGVRLVEEALSGPASGPASEVEPGAEVEVGAETGAGAGARIGGGGEAGAAIAAQVADVADVDVAEGEVGRARRVEAEVEGVEGDVVPVIRPRAEIVMPEVVDGGPSDVFTGSAFEAMLQFPPLSAEEFGGGEGGADVVASDGGRGDAESREAGPWDAGMVDAGADAEVEAVSAAMARASVTGTAADAEAETEGDAEAGVGSAEGAERADAYGAPSVLMGEMAAACACDGACEADAEARAEAEAGVDGEELRADSVEVEGAGGDLDLFEGVEEERRHAAGTRAGAAASVGWALVPLVSLGLLTPVAIGYAAFRLRSRKLAVATACYSVAIVAAFVVSAALPVHTRAQSAIGDLMTTCLAVAWLGGTAHTFMLRRRVFGLGK